ncbi:MAG: ABC transporter permease [Herpetosiphonaceae bacterium]|nr:ABC transporter permease [Herpetosiphonaceae bacterium]
MNYTPLSTISPRSYIRAILAIAKKDWLHFLRYPLEGMFRIIEPVMWLTPIYFLGRSFATSNGATGFAAYVGTVDYMSFVLIGGIISSYVSAVFWGMGFSLKREMDSGVLESNWMAPLPRPLFLIGQTVASISITSVNSVVVLFLAWRIFGFHVTGHLFPALLALAPMLVALYGFGFAFAGLVLLLKDANTMVDVANFMVIGLAGSQFPVQVLPRVLIPVALALPLTYGYDAVRGYLLGTRTLIPIHDELVILLVFMVVMTVAGYAFFRMIERHVKVRGTLGTH